MSQPALPQEQQLAELTEAIVALARLDFSARPPVRGGGPLDAVAAGLAALGEELQASLDAQRVAEEANQAKAAFLANMSHEFRTPLTSIIGSTELLAASGLEPQQLELLRRIEGAGQSLLRLTTDILDFAKLEAGRLTMVEEDFCPLESLERVLEQHRAAAAARGLAFSFCADGLHDQRVCGDHVRFEQVVSNLLGNAIKYTSSGGVEVYAGASQVGSSLELRVDITDTGPGIPAEELASIFERFHTGSRHRRRSGAGLGLSISKALVELMGGDLQASSVLGEGSTFGLVVRLPLSEAGSGRRRDEHSAQALSLRVLVVDDTEMVRVVTADMLSALGCTVTQAESGGEALLAVGRQDFDLILMDCQMPVLDGLETARQLHQLHPERDLRIVAMTAHTTPADVALCRAAGMVGHLAKPYTLQQLRSELLAYCPRPSGRPN